jgi:hypothetical protein
MPQWTTRVPRVATAREPRPHCVAARPRPLSRLASPSSTRAPLHSLSLPPISPLLWARHGRAPELTATLLFSLNGSVAGQVEHTTVFASPPYHRRMCSSRPISTKSHRRRHGHPTPPTSHGRATLSHHGQSREPQHLRLIVFEPARALAAGQRRRRAVTTSMATAEPPAPVAGRPQAISSRSVTTHGCGMARRCPRCPSPSPAPTSPAASPFSGARDEGWLPLSLSLCVCMTGGPHLGSGSRKSAL